MTTVLVLIRSAHFASCLLLSGVWAFDRLVVASLGGVWGNFVPAEWKRIVGLLMWLLLPLSLTSGALWLVWIAANMSGLPVEQAIRPGVFGVVWKQTAFGAAWHWHLAAWSAAALFSGVAVVGRWPARLQAVWSWCALVASGVLAASLVWAGHGLTESNAHRIADGLHLLAAGVWPGGLPPFLWLLWAARDMAAGERRRFRWMLTRRFSALSVIIVAVLLGSGLANGFFLVGSVSSLLTTAYGRWLVVKVLLFLVMCGLGAMNLLHWKQRMSVATEENVADSAGRWIHCNVMLEILIAGIIIVIVGLLGILPPAR